MPAGAAESSFTDLSLTELMNEPVTTVSKKTTRLGDAPAAITVITAEDIRRNGFNSIPEALRMVPGFDVARIDASHWAISSRGLNQQYANTLLVLVDGRSVYTPAFGGVYWDAQDMTLDDLDRIEVIRGPGATLWGANAVNGVVNIISKSARETQGVLLSVAQGNEEQPQLDARYGGAVGEKFRYRVYTKYVNRDGLRQADGTGSYEDWHSFRTGFRSDWDRAADQLVTVQGDYYYLREQHLQDLIEWAPPFVSTYTQHRKSEGGNVVARWTETLSDVSHISVQSYFDIYDTDSESRRTADVQLEHRFAPAAHHDVVWGLGYRDSRDHLHLGASFVTVPARERLSLYTAFAQDEISLAADRVRITVGTKLEHNDFTGLEVQPNLRVLFAPSSHTSVWAAASRAVSTPSRVYHDTRCDARADQPPASPIIVTSLIANPDLPSQKLDSFEIGYRAEPMKRVSLDIATFYNRYRSMYGLAQGAPFFEPQPVPHLVVPLTWQASMRAHAHGAEVAVGWRPLDRWHLAASYGWLDLEAIPVNTLGVGSPVQQASLRSTLAVSSAFEISSALYYVDGIDSLAAGLQTMRIPSYLRFDTGLLYRPSATLELGLWGMNLLDARHPEASSEDAAVVSNVPRSVLGRITKRF